ncbi:uncharacterized protein LOC113794562 [Dermatophagoides pteronyssinus]|uniref:uncharacterized protein LOC113794562 n=1 Tax=Dermatophagoides pteronyssinus TaxID=6956 RepID=UPI003F67874E
MIIQSYCRFIFVRKISINSNPLRLLSSKGKFFDDSDEKTKQTKQAISDLKAKQLYPEYEQTEYGIVYDRKPFKYQCIAGKAYFWCSCGHSHKQPFCDGTHRNEHLKIKLKPLRWDCNETKEYWFCNCKQTKHPPFCDGTHRQKSIQDGPSTIRDHHSPPLVIEKIKKK